jgi:hypothetical protein
MIIAGAGAVVVGLVSVFPQLVWLSEHKAAIFGVAAVMLVLSGSMLHRASRLPCPTDPDAARMCVRLRRVSAGLFWTAAAAYCGRRRFCPNRPSHRELIPDQECPFLAVASTGRRNRGLIFLFRRLES